MSNVVGNRGVAEEVDVSDLGIPRIRVTQKMSPHFDEGLADLGEFYCVDSGTNFGKSFKAIVYHYQKSFIIEVEKKEGQMYGDFVSATLMSPGISPPIVPDGHVGYLIYDFFLVPTEGAQAGKTHRLTLTKTGTSTARELIRSFVNLKEKENKTSLEAVVTFVTEKDTTDKDGTKVSYFVTKIEKDGAYAKLVPASTIEVATAIECYDAVVPGLLARKPRALPSASSSTAKVGVVC